MLKREITYEDFNGVKSTETFYFNLSKTEMAGWDLGGMAASIERMAKAQDTASLVTEIQKIVLTSYGEKSEDGKRFIKSEELRTAFSQTAAYDALFMELAQDEQKLLGFFQGVFPKEFADQLKQATPTVPQTTQPIVEHNHPIPIPEAPPAPPAPTAPRYDPNTGERL
jgi:hypothetical protein